MPKAKKTRLEKFAAELETDIKRDNRPADLHVTVADHRNLLRSIINAAREANDA